MCGWNRIGFFFFFQAEDGIRDWSVTGVQTCALPILASFVYALPFGRGRSIGSSWNRAIDAVLGGWQMNGILTFQTGQPLARSEERRVGKECRSRWSPYH